MRESLAVVNENRSSSEGKDSWGTNCFNDASEDVIFAVKRPGAVITYTAGTAGQGVFVWDGSFFVIADDELIEIGERWDADINYVAGDVVWYDGFAWYALGSSFGQSPFNGSAYWRYGDIFYLTDSYDPSATYAVGDTVTSNNITYYAYAPNLTGISPTSEAGGWLWSTTPTTSDRWSSDGGTTRYASPDACGWILYDTYPYKSCDNAAPISNVWLTSYIGAVFLSGVTWRASVMYKQGNCSSSTGPAQTYISTTIIKVA